MPVPMEFMNSPIIHNFAAAKNGYRRVEPHQRPIEPNLLLQHRNNSLRRLPHLLNNSTMSLFPINESETTVQRLDGLQAVNRDGGLYNTCHHNALLIPRRSYDQYCPLSSCSPSNAMDNPISPGYLAPYGLNGEFEELSDLREAAENGDRWRLPGTISKNSSFITTTGDNVRRRREAPVEVSNIDCLHHQLKPLAGLYGGSATLAPPRKHQMKRNSLIVHSKHADHITGSLGAIYRHHNNGTADVRQQICVDGNGKVDLTNQRPIDIPAAPPYHVCCLPRHTGGNFYPRASAIPVLAHQPTASIVKSQGKDSVPPAKQAHGFVVAGAASRKETNLSKSVNSLSLMCDDCSCKKNGHNGNEASAARQENSSGRKEEKQEDGRNGHLGGVAQPSEADAKRPADLQNGQTGASNAVYECKEDVSLIQPPRMDGKLIATQKGSNGEHITTVSVHCGFSSSDAESKRLSFARAAQLSIHGRLMEIVSTSKVKSNFKRYYSVEKFVRSGGFSDIFEGRRLMDKCKVILKFIPKQKTKNWLMIKGRRYPSEVLLHKAVSDLKGVVNFLDYFEETDCWIIVLECLPLCCDLFDYMERMRYGRLNESQARSFFSQLVSANVELAYRGVVHRDIKSENVLLDVENNRLVLIDFGASAILQDEPYSDFHGTRQFSTPEYITYAKYHASPSTVWALGVLLYDMVVGRLPFENEADILTKDVKIWTPVSNPLRQLIYKCLQRKPELRPKLEELLRDPWITQPLQCQVLRTSVSERGGDISRSSQTSDFEMASGSDKKSDGVRLNDLLLLADAETQDDNGGVGQQLDAARYYSPDDLNCRSPLKMGHKLAHCVTIDRNS